MRKMILASLTTVLVGAGLVSGQGYHPGYPPYGYAPYPPQGYAFPVPTRVPAAMPAPGVLHGMPGGYAQPYRPQAGRAQVTDAKPRLIGWPPAPGSIPAPPGQGQVLYPQQSNAPVQGTQQAQASGKKPVATVSAQGNLPPVRNANHPEQLKPGQERVLILPDAGSRSVPANPASLRHHSGKACTDCGSSPLLHPAPGTALMCDDGACDPCATCAEPCQPIYKALNKKPCSYHIYGRSEALYWWVEEQESPTLFSFLTPRGNADINAASLDNGERTGVRNTVGFWLDPTEQLWGLEASMLYLLPRNPSFGTSGGMITRPFVNAVNGQPASLAISTPGVLNGAATARSGMELWSVEGNVRRQVWGFGCGHIDLLAGVRYLRLDEYLAVETVDDSPAQAGLAGTASAVDRFDTENEFIGGQLGLEGEIQFNRLYVNPWGKCAFGVNRRFISIAGNRVVPVAGGGTALLAGNVLALPSNIGTDRTNEFSFLPEVGINVGIRLTSNLRLGVGYSGLALIDAVRPGNQVNNTVNLTQLPLPGVAPAPVPPLAPVYSGMRDSVFFAHGFNANLEFRW